MHLGIDYGSKLAGTTAICFEKNEQLHIVQSEKKKDADQFIKQIIQSLEPSSIFIDAPLSLPLAYFEDGTDYFYRTCDKELRGMSPMFLGGLTARAIKLKHFYKALPFYETYPAQIVKHYLVEAVGYKKQQTYLADFCQLLSAKLPFGFSNQPVNWHQVDSILAWWAGWRFENETVKTYGNKKEGLIYI